jgi:hypothetical protein
MPPVRTGTASQVDASASSGSASVTVPSDATGVVAFWGHWSNNNNSTLSTLTLNSVSMLPAKSEIAEGATTDEIGVGAAFLASPSTGSQTLAWAWSAGGARVEGGEIVLVYVKDLHASTPYRAAATDVGTGSGDVSVNVSSETTDLLLAWAVNSPGGGNPGIDGTVFINNGTVNGEIYDASEVTPNATSTTVNMTGEQYAGMAAITLQEAVSQGTSRAIPTLRTPTVYVF